MFDDIISGMADYLGTTEGTAELLLSVAILVSIGLGMSVARTNLVGTAIVLVSCMGLLTLMGWFPLWIMVLVILVAAGMFGSEMVRWLTGDTGGGA